MSTLISLSNRFVKKQLFSMEEYYDLDENFFYVGYFRR
ncbi:protein of unknown function [Brevefilum fermentans]|uniref:Uncharacterized protein n=1 Tax=Candidatus Brevifilum fermentans TaxID=1986204 RepID=A0A1Y6K3A2_9CHLR|nr:protein of unknown function [Brevefilum fermentans]